MSRDKFPFYIIMAVVAVIAGCTGPDKEIIPSDKMVDIVEDLYMSDQFIASERDLKGRLDSLLLYEGILESYGYTFADYIKSTEYYLQQGDMLKRIHLKAKDNLTKRRNELSVKNSNINNVKKAFAPFMGKNADDLWKEPYLRSLCHLAGIELEQEWDITDTVAPDIPQNSKWWIYNITARQMADSLYPPLVRDYLIDKERESVQESKDEKGVKTKTLIKRPVHEKNISKLPVPR